MPNGKREDYYSVITDAINYFAEHGYDTEDSLAYWTMRIREAGERTLGQPTAEELRLRQIFADIYKRMIDRGQITRFHPGIGRFTIDQVRPQLRAELDRRIMASANLIKLNRKQAIDKTLQRFQGWATSIPKGGSKAVDKREEKESIRKPLAQLKFEERRVAVDQGHKFVSALNNILAKDGGAIALTWNSHWRQPNYQFREDHKERDGLVYAIPGTWAFEQGLAKPGRAGWYNRVTAVGEEVFCRCFATYIYSLRSLPADMITRKGQAALLEARNKLNRLRADMETRV